LKKICLFLIGIAAFTCHAQMLLPPVLSTQAEQESWAMSLRQQIPEIQSSPSYKLQDQALISFITMEQTLVARLKADPRYMEAARTRPALQKFLISRVEYDAAIGDATNERWTIFLREHSAREVHDADAIKDKLVQAFMAWPKKASISFFSGWASLLSKADKNLLSEPDLATRWQNIKTALANKDMEEIRSKFKATRFGINSPDWTWTDLDQIVQEIDNFENEIIMDLQALHSLRVDAEPQEAAWIMAELSADVEERARETNTLKLLDALTSRAQKLFVDGEQTIRIERPVQQLVLRELPPYLAIYRGCVGSDCSTSASWAFPYSPYERNWWIEDLKGKHLGYVSGNITLYQGNPCLYIRDITGPGLKEGDIALILDGFYQARYHYGANNMTMTPLAFVTQNHFQLQQAELTRYPGVAANVHQTFQDAWIRDNYLAMGQGGHAYDGIDKHTHVRLVQSTGNAAAHVKLEVLIGDKALDTNPRTNPAVLFNLLNVAVMSKNVNVLEYSHPDANIPWSTLIQAIKNSRRLNVADYQRDIEDAFSDAKLPFSRNLVRKYESMFMEGHMAAPDALSGDKNTRQAIRYVMDLLWRSDNAEPAKDYIEKHLELFESHELMVRNVHSLFERRQPVDVARILTLWNAGYRFKNQKFTPDDLTWLMQSVTEHEIVLWAFAKIAPEKRKTFQFAEISLEVQHRLAFLLENSDETIDESYSERAAQILYSIKDLALYASDEVMREVQLSITEDDNLKVQIPLSILYLSKPGNTDPTGLAAYKILKDAQNNMEVSAKWRKESARALRDLNTRDMRIFLDQVEAEAASLAAQAGNCEVQLQQTRRRL
jgi:hypothetical protein